MKYDVFICHASEDKADFVRRLAEALRRRGLNVWYDEFTLQVGDSLPAKIDEGLRDSQCGVVILSHAFFGKNWPRLELDALVARQGAEGRSLILPIWHKVTREEVSNYSPVLARTFALKSEDGLRKVCDQIVKAAFPDRVKKRSRKKAAPAQQASSSTPYTLKNLKGFLREAFPDFLWDSYERSLYDLHRSVNIALVEQLREAVEDADTRDLLRALYVRLLGREPDALGIVSFAPRIFLRGAAGLQEFGAHIVGSREYRSMKTRNRVGLPSPPTTSEPIDLEPGMRLPEGWAGDSWMSSQPTVYFLRAWKVGGSVYAVKQGPHLQEVFRQMLAEIEKGGSGRAEVKIKES